ncbi:MAG: serine hydrolase, partial [Bacteroidota bacterium]
AAYKLVSIDAIVQQAIRLGAFPGAQVLVAKEGKVIYQKSFGKHQFDNRQLVHADDLYDLASITKIASTTLAMMHLYEQRAFKLNSAIGPYIQCDKKQPIGKLSFKRLLTHQSGLQANMPIAPFIMFEDTTNLACNTYFCKSRKSPTDIQIADSMFMTSTWVDSIWQEVYSLKPRRRKRFRYSDVNFNLIQRFIESHTKMGLDRFVNQQFYRSLHMQHTAFRPLEKFKAHQIIPTTDDKKWRKQLLRGYVHDESAALLGGVGGNSGLFSNTQDLAVLFQMLLNGGNYGGKKYLKKSTIDYFTAARHGNHRGLGFDKPTKTRNRTSSDKASRQTYGHTGFTGTCVWVDPAEDLIFIFLTNRISPDIHNKKIFKHKVRKRLHNVVYEALNTYEAPTDVLLPREEVNLERVRASVE